MISFIRRLQFDRQDHQLIRMVNAIVARDEQAALKDPLQRLHFHPNGIREMTEAKGLRAALAAARLLRSLDTGSGEERLLALRSLHQEVVETAEGPLPRNTARVLLQVMKALVRAKGDYRHQLELSYEFRQTATGKPRIVRRQLQRYHLLEMPENWRQISFDDHVHDASTKGRKSASHLIMDAWIKGIRRLRIVHYNYIEPRSAAELIEAARIMQIDVRIGIEFYCRHRDKYAQLIWVPRGFIDAQSFLCFLTEAPVEKMMAAGRAVSDFQQRFVMALFDRFNRVHRPFLNAKLSIRLAPVAAEDFLAYVGSGQKSRLHLIQYLHKVVLAALDTRVAALRQVYRKAGKARQRKIAAWIEKNNSCDLEALIEERLSPAYNPDIACPERPLDDPELPALLQLDARQLIERLAGLHTGFRLTLNLNRLTVADVLELIYDSKGLITRIELYNLKDNSATDTAGLEKISRLMRAINNGSTIRLKQVIGEIITGLKTTANPPGGQLEKLSAILYDIDALSCFYSEKSIKARMGSDSTGRSARMFGMGLAVVQTLPARARRLLKQDLSSGQRQLIPVRISVAKIMRFVPRRPVSPDSRWRFLLTALLPFGDWSGWRYRESWKIDPRATRLCRPGNIVILGGVQQSIDNGFYLNPPPKGRRGFGGCYLNTTVKNILKVAVGFVPAFLTFYWTKDWWLLACFGGVIWFAITGVRNIVQSVLGGGGIRRSPLLKWNDYISWSRIADSMLFTGFSVPLLDYLVKTLILERGFGISAGAQPVLLYGFMALANGIYLSGHNLLRGLPKGAVYGNFFRSILSIPVAIGLNTVIGMALGMAGVASAGSVLQKWAAIISKFASDIVAGFIEGVFDRQKNIRTRLRDYRMTLDQLFAVYARLEMLYPEVPPLKVLEHAGHQSACAEGRDLEKIVMMHALDLLYFWMYQPRGQTALRRYIARLSEDERQILLNSQYTLLRYREISQMLIDGVLGERFQRPLSFYLTRYPGYLKAVKKLVFDPGPARTERMLSNDFDPSRWD